MVKKIIKTTTNISKHEADIARYMQEVRDMEAAGITRRDLFKMGLTAGAGGIAAIGGKNFLPNLAESATKTNGIISPPCNKPWTDALPIPKTCQSVATVKGPQPTELPSTESVSIFHPGYGPLGGYRDFQEARTEIQPRWDEFGGANALTKYELEAREIDWNFYPTSEYPSFNSKVWTYKDQNSDAVGPLLIKAYYGEPVLMRLYNCLPVSIDINIQPGDNQVFDLKIIGGDNQGFGINQMSLHVHNAHNPSVSDGGPYRFFDSGSFHDHFFPNIRAGFASTHKLGDIKNTPYIDNKGDSYYCPGDWRETQSSLWFHDHRGDFTAQNVYKGLVSFYSLFSRDINLDTNDESSGLGLPSGDYDIPIVITDKQFDQSGQMFLDIFEGAGFLGDHQTVNFKIKPYLDVKRRKYRFRILSGGPGRFIEISLKHASNSTANMQITRIANDGNLLTKAQVVSSIRLAPAERADIIIDFSQYKQGDVIYLENRLEQIKLEGTSGKILPSSAKTELLQFRVGESADDLSASMDRLQNQKMLDLPILPKTPAKKRSFSFGKKNATWTINGKLDNPLVMEAYPCEGTMEEWTFFSGGGWSHPVHIHGEEGQIISRNGKQPAIDDLSRKDVYRIGDGSEDTAGTSSLTINIQFRDWIGDFVCHCHNNMHEDMGMMFRFKVVPPDDPKAGT